MTVVVCPSIRTGYFARSESFPHADEEIAHRVFCECVNDYKAHVARIRAGLDDHTANFLDRYALGGFHRQSLHDETIIRLTVLFEQKETDADAAIEISLSDVPGLSVLRIEYAGLVNWEMPVGQTFALIRRHELMENEGLLQHTLYTYEQRPISFVFERLTYREL